jgi:hypothetical protein
MGPEVRSDPLLEQGIRTAGPLCGPWRLQKARSFSRITTLTAERRIVVRQFTPKNRTEKLSQILLISTAVNRRRGL